MDVNNRCLSILCIMLACLLAVAGCRPSSSAPAEAETSESRVSDGMIQAESPGESDVADSAAERRADERAGDEPPMDSTAAAVAADEVAGPSGVDPRPAAGASSVGTKPRLNRLEPLRPQSASAAAPRIAHAASADSIQPGVARVETETVVPRTAAPQIRSHEAAAPVMIPREMSAPAEMGVAGPSATSIEAPSDTTAEGPAATDAEGATRIKVFYATDRSRVADMTEFIQWQPFVPALIVVGVALILGIYARTPKNKTFAWAAFVALLGGVALGVKPGIASLDRWTGQSQHRIAYGNDRGQLEMGVCEISIPQDHRVGEVESPSVLRLEFRQDEKKHVVLHDVLQLEDTDFFGQLRECVQTAKRKEVFVFVHGYNVTFDNAARRTAQIAYDLKFEGAPIFYSWPSQGGLLKYTVDETNVAWTVPHLKQFLLSVARQSGADSVNLIAHSMGNRALTGALRELSLELQQDARLFNQVILAAPDIDAEIFRRDLAPAMVQASRRVTLYASSNDQALIASKQVHGYPRAGDSGDSLVILSGVDTIDVSTVDTSLLGHSYYGNSNSILADIYQLIHLSRPAHERRFLRPMPRDGLTYWVFQPAERTARNSD